MSNRVGGQSMHGRLRRVAVRPPDGSFGQADAEQWNYASPPLLEDALAEHRALVRLLEDSGAEVLLHDVPLPGLADSIFVYDPVLVVDGGIVVLSMGKELRRGEEEPLAGFLSEQGAPILGCLQGEARAEAGDLIWLDRSTLAVGLGYRTNQQGFDQLQKLLGERGIELVAVPLPVAGGERACLHLGSLISVVDHDLAVVHLPLLVVPIVEQQLRRRFELVEVGAEELATLGPNVLALGPRDCVLLEENVVTAERLRGAGCEVQTYRGRELSLKAEGGATCLTRPLLRDG